MALSHFALLLPGNFTEAEPEIGLEESLQLFELAEDLGFDSAWVRQRHLERGIGSAPVFLAAASQRCKRIGLGTAVIQLGYETPFRLAEDLALLDVLSRGRLEVGVSAGPAPFASFLGDLLPLKALGGGKYAQPEALARALRAEPLSDQPIAGNAAGGQIPRLQPIAKGLGARLWYGAGGQASALWAGQNGWNLLSGNVISAEESEDFLTNQAQLVALWRAALAAKGHSARLGLGRVILPFDSADRTTRESYRAFAEARLARTKQPNGPRRTLFLPDLIGGSQEILRALEADPILPHADHLRLELPYDFSVQNYAQIMRDFIKLKGAIG